ncbi:Rieske (2Fe-2S) protein [Isoalcanivorax indicus]|uniref:Rieske (2Fe-2S) protein n=1 Tax=Isoalcanivorax indicus TaxID=2202653 RepID=UPI000DB9C4FF|nr:Rieske 2Fe-2S domain-containing protein [Isoalcanivorax indicus]
MTFHRLLRLDQVHDGLRARFRIGRHELLLISVGTEVFLLDARCPHAGSDLGRGTLSGYQLRCPGHGQVFDVRECGRAGQPVGYPVEYDGQWLGVSLP